MAYQERTTTSYGQRLGKSGKGIGTGILLLIAGTVLLWFNAVSYTHLTLPTKARV